MNLGVYNNEPYIQEAGYPQTHNNDAASRALRLLASGLTFHMALEPSMSPDSFGIYMASLSSCYSGRSQIMSSTKFTGFPYLRFKWLKGSLVPTPVSQSPTMKAKVRVPIRQQKIEWRRQQEGVWRWSRREWAPTAGHRNGPDSWDREMPERTGHNPDTGENISQVMREEAKGLDTKAR